MSGQNTLNLTPDEQAEVDAQEAEETEAREAREAELKASQEESGYTEETEAKAGEESAKEDEAEAGKDDGTEAEASGEASEDKETAEAGETEAEEAEASQKATDKSLRDPYIPRLVDEAPDFEAAEQKISESLTQAQEEHDQKMADLDAKYDEGDLDAKDYMKQVRAIDRELNKAEQQATRQEMALEQQKREIQLDQKFREQAWADAENEFFDANPQFGKSRALMGALDGALQELYEAEENAGKSFRWFLNEAKTKVDHEFGLTDRAEREAERQANEKAEKEQAEAKPPAGEKPPRRKSGVEKAPKTISDVPAASDNPGEGKFDWLDKLDGPEQEAQLARMPEEEVMEYLSRAPGSQARMTH